MRPDGRPSGPRRPDQARVFFALWPPAEVRRGLEQAAADSARLFGGRAMRPETLHLTLAFIGDVALDRLPALHAAADEVRSPAFRLCLDRLGFWGHNRILWAGSRDSCPGLTALAGKLAGSLRTHGWPTGIRDGKDFAPHVTLVRKVVAGKPELPAIPAMDWDCDSFVLARSRLAASGSAYEIIGRWPLD